MTQPGPEFPPPEPNPNNPGAVPPPPPYGGTPYAGMPMPGAPINPGAPYGVDPQTGIPYSDKSKITAGLLQILLGGVGAGRWYTGSYGVAVAQLLTCGGLGVWSLIDGIMMLTGNGKDPQGRPLHP